MSPFKHLVELMEAMKDSGIDLHILFPYPEFNEDGSQDTCICIKGITYIKDDSSVGYHYGPKDDIDEGKEKGYLFDVMEQNYGQLKSYRIFNILPVIREAEYVKHPLTGAYIYRIRGVPFIYSDNYGPEYVTFCGEEEEEDCGWQEYKNWFGAAEDEGEEEEEEDIESEDDKYNHYDDDDEEDDDDDE